MNKNSPRVMLQIALFLATVFTTTLVGAEYLATKPVMVNYSINWELYVLGFQYSIPFLMILTAHEFGHYFTARYHKVTTTLPFYLPFPFITGTMGAVILQGKAATNKQSFDIGIAGPLAGFVVAIGILVYGYMHLPPADYIFQIHPEYKQYGLDYAKHVYAPKENVMDLSVGKNLIFWIFEQFASDPSRIPNPHEVMHYPLLFAGFISLIFTFLNLMPIGQLDGGHVLYGLLGHGKHKIVASVIFVVFLFYAGLGNQYINPEIPLNKLILYSIVYVGFIFIALIGLKLPLKDTIMYATLIFGVQFVLAKFVPSLTGYEGWLLFALILGRFIGIEHPKSDIEEPLDFGRKVIGWIALLIFVLCFSPAPLVLTAALPD